MYGRMAPFYLTGTGSIHKKHVSYVSEWGNKRQAFISQLALHHRHFQPQIREDFNCSALAMTGHEQLSYWRWITINCFMMYKNVAIVCKHSGENNSIANISRHINTTEYNRLVYSKKSNTALHIPQKYCQSTWLYDNGLCVRFFTHVMEGCEELSYDQIKKAIQTSSPTVTKILRQFQDVPASSSVYLAKCVEPLTISTLHLQPGVFQCSDGTFIIEHHLCDGETDYPDAYDESNCSWVCHHSANYTQHHNCFLKCTKPSCTCHHLYFQCNSGGCVPMSKFCNGVTDCPDASDEVLCTQHNASRKQSDNDRQSASEADDIIHNICSSADTSERPPEESGLFAGHTGITSDDTIQKHGVAEILESFVCHTGDRISRSRVNDTVRDCPIHGDDEPFISQYSIIDYNDSMPLVLPCISGHPKLYKHYEMCLLTRQASGELAACRNGGHLSDCIYHSCPQHHKCAYSYCIPIHAVCNGGSDCPKGEDEQNCYTLSCPGTLKCKRDNLCVHPNDVSNGLVDCPGYEDDEATAMITACPSYCECLGHAAFCSGDVLKSHELMFVSALIWHSVTGAKFASKTLGPVESLKYLDLSNNILKKEFSFIFRPLHSLVKLILVNASISEVQPNTFSGLCSVRDLQLQRNSIPIIYTDGFSGLSVLPILDLSKLNIQTLFSCSFRGLQQLVHLDISFNMLTHLERRTFCGLESLQILYLQYNDIVSVHSQILSFTTHLQVLISNITGLCCYANILRYAPEVHDQHAPCTSILHRSVITYCIYLIAIISVGQNIVAFVIYNLLFVAKNTKKRVCNMFQKQLLLSDAAMGCFFLMLSICNTVFQDDFVIVGHLWTQSIYCRALSFISLLSLEMSLFVVLIIAMERYFAMCFPLKDMHISVSSAWSMSLSAWLVAITLSLLPVLSLYFNNLGLNNAMCVTMLSFALLDIWIVAGIYVINTIVIVTTLVLYLGVIKAVRSMQQSRQNAQARRSRERLQLVTTRIVLLIFTNSSCWLVLGTVSLLQMIGFSITKTVLAVIVTVALPISTLLNPILNVYTTQDFFEIIKEKCFKS